MLEMLLDLLIIHIIIWCIMAKLYENKAFLTKRYLVEKKSLEEIAKECGVSHQTIYRYLVKHNLIRDPRKFGKK